MTNKVFNTVRVFGRLLTRMKRRWLLTAVVMLFLGGLVFYLVVRPPVLPQPAIYLLDDVILPIQGQAVLVFSPHPDDETIAAGGYIAASVRESADVRIVLITDGNKGLNNKNTRYLEFKQATAKLGIQGSNLIFLGFPDGKLRNYGGNTLYERLKEQIDLFDSDIIIYPDTRDDHPDHSTTGRIIEDILKEESSVRISYQYLVHYKMFFPQPRKFDTELYLLPPINLVSFNSEWHRFMLPQEVEDLKVEATYAYRSQLRDPLSRSLLLSSIRKNELFAVLPFP
ncbi:MAG: PIG-L family deacetylase [Chloroflexota bacterium]